MNISLHDPKIKSVLDGLYANATEIDDVIRPRVMEALQTKAIADDREAAPMLREAFMAVAPEVGRLIYQLVRAKRPALVVEFGTSYGLSTIHIAAALRDNGEGRLITTEMESAKVVRARAIFVEAGLDDLIELRGGDAFEALRNISGIDLLLLDGWKKLYLPLLRQLEPALAPGAMILADDTTLVPAWVEEYLCYVRDPSNGYASVEIPLDDGIEISTR